MVTKILKCTAAVVLLIFFGAAGVLPAIAAGPEGNTKEKPALVDVNSASAADLEKLPGIGPALAKRIVEFREKNGPFQSVDDLIKVQGIGEKSLARFREFVTASKPQKKQQQ